jgi:hypothetical protein
LSKCQNKNFVILPKEIFEKKINKVGKNKFYNEQKQVKDCVTKYILKIMELNVRIAIFQLVDNKQVYKEIPPVSVLSIASNQNENFYRYVVFLLNESFSKTCCKTNNTYE